MCLVVTSIGAAPFPWNWTRVRGRVRVCVHVRVRVRCCTVTPLAVHALCRLGFFVEKRVLRRRACGRLRAHRARGGRRVHAQVGIRRGVPAIEDRRLVLAMHHGGGGGGAGGVGWGGN